MPRYHRTSVDPKASWRERALCRIKSLAYPMLQSAWDTENNPMSETAKDICAECPVRLICLYDALNDPQATGFRAGYFFTDGSVSRDDANRMWKDDKIRTNRVKRVKAEGWTHGAHASLQGVWSHDHQN